MPLVWAHAEFLRLLAARAHGRPIELPDVVRERYGGRRPQAATWYWREEVPIRTLPPGRSLVIEDRGPFVLHFGSDGWERTADRAAVPLGLGMFGVRFAPEELRGRELRFTRFYPSTQRWEGRDHVIALGSAA